MGSRGSARERAGAERTEKWACSAPEQKRPGMTVRSLQDDSAPFTREPGCPRIAFAGRGKPACKGRPRRLMAYAFRQGGRAAAASERRQERSGFWKSRNCSDEECA